MKRVRIEKYTGVYYREHSVRRHNGKPDRCFDITYHTPGGKFKWETVGWASEGYNSQMASQVRGERIRAIQHGEELPSRQKAREAEITLSDLWEKYIEWAKVHKKTWKDDEYHYHAHLEPRFGKTALKDLGAFQIEKMKTEMKKGANKHGKPFATATIKHQIVLLRRLFNLASKWGIYTGPNPVASVQMPKLDNQVTEFLTDEERARLYDVLETWPCRDTVAFIRFAVFTGMRRGELFKLTWDAVDFERGFVTIRDPKGGKTMTIPLSDEALSVLKGLERKHDYVFPGKDGKQRTDFKGPWLRVRAAARLPENFRFHGLRHNFASQLVSNGTDLYIVQQLLCHKQSSTTQRYAHLQPDALKRAAALSGKLLKATDDAKTDKDAASTASSKRHGQPRSASLILPGAE